jgi:hypothetical protein
VEDKIELRRRRKTKKWRWRRTKVKRRRRTKLRPIKNPRQWRRMKQCLDGGEKKLYM